MIITKEEIELLRPFIPQIDWLVAQNDLDELQDEITTAMIAYGYDSDEDEIQGKSNETYELLDDIYWSVTHRSKPRRKKTFLDRMIGGWKKRRES